MKLFRGGLLANLMVPQKEYLFTDEPSFFKATRAKRFTIYSELRFFIDQFRTRNITKTLALQYLSDLAKNPIVPVKRQEDAFDAVLEGTYVNRLIILLILGFFKILKAKQCWLV